MAYGQKNYPQIIGRDTGHNYKISQVGCFLVSFCNLMERFGRPVDPLTLNQFFVDASVYVDAPPRDNIFDDLDWGLITRYNGNIGFNVGPGAPHTNDAIVKFIYGANNEKTHFCLVADAAAGLIVDSWDGVVKSWNVYGGPKQYASYVYNQPAPVQIDPIVIKPSYEYARFDNPIDVRVKPNMNLWDLNSFVGGYSGAVSIAQLSTDPNAPTEFTAVGRAIKQDMPEHPVYYMSAESFGDADKTGVPTHNQGVNSVDIGPVPVPAPAPEPVVDDPQPQSAPEPDGEIVDVHVLPPNPEAWKATYKTNNSGDYKAVTDVICHDVEDPTNDKKDRMLLKGEIKKIAGDFTGPDGVSYWRTVVSASRVDPKTLTPKDEDWRGIPKEIDGKPTMEEDESIFGYMVDEARDFGDGIIQTGKRAKVIVATARKHGQMDWLFDRLKKKGTK